MAASYIWKPSTIHSWKRGIAFLAPSNTDRGITPSISAGGKTYTGRYINTNEGRHQWVFPKELASMSDLQLSFGDFKGTIGTGSRSYEGGGIDSWKERNKGSLGASAGSGTGDAPEGAQQNGAEGGGTGAYEGPDRFRPGAAGEHGVYPGYQGDFFPDPSLIKYEDMEAAPYNFTDPKKFAEDYGEFNRGEIRKNFDLAKDIGLKELETELQGMEKFVPAAAALKRRETSIDNLFNQYQRDRQVDQALPGVRGELSRQTGRAEAFASGRMPSELEDRALELGIRSSAADRATAGGFGATSSVARKTSDLMSAAQRIELSKYGDQALTQNIGTRAGLFLAPTEYSQAGTEIRVMPEVGAGRLTQGALSEFNQYNVLPVGTAMSSVISQEQYRTNLEQTTRQFNKQMNFNTDQFNANTENTFKLKKFDYDVGYAGMVAGAYQTDHNTQLELDQQEAARATAEENRDATQRGNTAQSVGQTIAAGAGAVLGALTGGGSSGSNGTDGTSGSDGAKGEKGDQGAGGGAGPQGTTGPQGEGGGTGPKGEQGAPGETPPAGGRGPAGEPSRDGTDSGPDGDTTVTDGSGGGNGTGGGGSVSRPSDDSASSGAVDSNDRDGNGAPDTDKADDYVYEREPDGATDDGDIGTADNQTEVGSSIDDGNFTSDGEEPPSEQMFRVGRIEATDPEIRQFSQDTGIKVYKNQVDEKELNRSSSVPLKNAGVFDKNGPGRVKKGVNYQGTTQFHDQSIANDPAGAQAADSDMNDLRSFLKPLGVDIDEKFAQDVMNTAKDAKFGAKLFGLWEKGDKKGFINAILDKYHGKAITSITDDPQMISGLNAAYSGYKLFQGWGNMSDAQRAKALMSLGLQSYKSATGESLTNMVIPGTLNSAGKNGITVGRAMQLAQLGYDVYSMASNWEDMSDAQKILTGTGTLVEAAKLMNSMGWLGMAESATASGTTAIAATSSEAAGQLTATEFAGYANGVLGVVAVGQGAYTTYQGWGDGGASGRAQGASAMVSMTAGGAAIGGSIAGPPGAIVGGAVGFVAGAISFAGCATKTGKHSDQNARDWYRGNLKERGFYGDDYKLALADGSVYDFGQDGNAGEHGIRDTSKFNGDPRNLRSYEIDYTNDMDYAAGATGLTLSRLIYGGRDQFIDQNGSQFGNALLGRVGNGKDMTEENYNLVMANARGMYAKAGITSKEDAYVLINRGVAEGRYTKADQIAMHQSINMMYDADGFSGATQILGSGRHKAIGVVQNEPDRKPTVTTGAPKGDSLDPDFNGSNKQPTKPVDRPRPSRRPGNVPEVVRQVDSSRVERPTESVRPTPAASKPLDTNVQFQSKRQPSVRSAGKAMLSKREPMYAKSKESLKERNKAKYQSSARR